MVRATAALLAILLPSAAHAATVTGAFVEKGGRAPLEGVEVVLRRAVDSTVVAHTTTGGDGRFRVDSLRFDRYLLRASLLGYEPYLRSDVVVTEEAPVLDLGTQVLSVSPIAVKGIETKTARPTAIVAADRNIYLTKDMPSATTGTATDILRTVPELDVDIDGRVSLRGSSSVNIQFNGRTAPLKGEALTTYLRQMPAGRIERVEVIANPSAKFDPEGMAGIVNIVLKDNVGLGLSGSVNASAGQRYSVTGGRVAWQSGPLTMYGGASGSLNRWLYRSSAERRGLLASSPSSVTWDVDNKYRGRYCLCDGSFDYAVTKHSTVYGTVNGNLGDGDPHSITHYALYDSSEILTSLYDRTDDGGSGTHTVSFTLGAQNVVEKGRNERSIEFMHSGTGGDNHTEGLYETFVPTGMADQVSRLMGASAYHERSVQVDDTHPLAAHAKLELGYRGAQRQSTNSSVLRYYSGDTLADAPLGGASDYAHREVFHSGYVTAGVTLGRLSLQGGGRAEAAHTTFDARVSGRHFDNDYRSLFPSANVAWDFGKGRIARASYTKRIERPSPYYLDPDVTSSDSLNRYVGNPYLGPKYTHSFGLDASWTGARGSVRLSPYLRNTVDNWDLVTTVDAAGAATSTYLNASSVRVYGVGVTGSLRQIQRLGGTMSVGVSHEHHDASNLSSLYRRDVTGWSTNGNVTFRATSKLDLQGYLRYAPARALAQGRASAYTAVNLSARLKLAEKAWLSLAINDPFKLATYSSTTGDATYTQRSANDNHMRSVSAAFTWTWGKPPEVKQRRQTGEQPQEETPAPGR